MIGSVGLCRATLSHFPCKNGWHFAITQTNYCILLFLIRQRLDVIGFVIGFVQFLHATLNALSFCSAMDVWNVETLSRLFQHINIDLAYAICFMYYFCKTIPPAATCCLWKIIADRVMFEFKHRKCLLISVIFLLWYFFPIWILHILSSCDIHCYYLYLPYLPCNFVIRYCNYFTSYHACVHNVDRLYFN